MSTNIKTRDKVEIKQRNQVQPHRKYKVILLNNPITLHIAVVEVLKEVFQKNDNEAMNIMLSADSNGQSLVMVSTREICEAKVAEANAYCYDNRNRTIHGLNMNLGALQFTVGEGSNE